VRAKTDKDREAVLATPASDLAQALDQGSIRAWET